MAQTLAATPGDMTSIPGTYTTLGLTQVQVSPLTSTCLPHKSIL